MSSNIKTCLAAVIICTFFSVVVLITYPMIAWISLYLGFGILLDLIPQTRSFLFIIPCIVIAIMVIVATRNISINQKIVVISTSLALIFLIGFLIYKSPNWEFFDPYNTPLIPTR